MGLIGQVGHFVGGLADILLHTVDVSSQSCIQAGGMVGVDPCIQMRLLALKCVHQCRIQVVRSDGGLAFRGRHVLVRPRVCIAQ